MGHSGQIKGLCIGGDPWVHAGVRLGADPRLDSGIDPERNREDERQRWPHDLLHHDHIAGVEAKGGGRSLARN